MFGEGDNFSRIGYLLLKLVVHEAAAFEL